MEKKFNQRTRSAAFKKSIAAWLVSVGITFVFGLLDIILRSVSGTSSTENFRGEFRIMMWAADIILIILILIYLVNFWIERAKLFPDIKITGVPISNSTLGDKGQLCFYVDVQNGEIEKLTEFWAKINTIVKVMPNGEAWKLIIDPDDAILIWVYYADIRITIDGQGGHAILKIIEEGSFLGEDGLFVRFITRTGKDTKLKLDEYSPNDFGINLWFEIELNGIWKESEIHPKRYYWHMGYHKNLGGIGALGYPIHSDIIFEEISKQTVERFRKAAPKIEMQKGYPPLTQNNFFKDLDKVEFIVKKER